MLNLNISDNDKKLAVRILKIVGYLILGTFILSFRVTRILAFIAAPVAVYLYLKKKKASNTGEVAGASEDVEAQVDEPATPVFYVGTTVPRRKQRAVFEVVGESYRKDNFLYIGVPNPDWNLSDSKLLEMYDVEDCIYKYSFDRLPCQIVREYTNSVDVNALRVDIDNTPVGYIAHADQQRIKPLLRRDNVSWSASVSWGPVKMIRQRGRRVFVHTEDYHFSVVLTAFS